MDNVIGFRTRRAATSPPPRRGLRAPAPGYSVRGSLREVMATLPRFERRQFGPGFAAIGAASFAHPRLHAIVHEHNGLPVGVVSPDYALIQHADALAAAAEGLRAHGVVTGACEVVAELTPHGEQMTARFSLPGLPSHTPPDGHPLVPTVMLSNSVDGKSALRANLGWFRLICMNGLIVPYAATRLRRRHAHGLSFSEISATVAAELARADLERRRLMEFTTARIERGALTGWIDGPLRARWGAQAATRVLHIVERGMDITLADPFESASPSARTVDDFAPVPGSGAGTTVWDALQALTWVASRGENLMQRWERESEALGLVEMLQERASSIP